MKNKKSEKVKKNTVERNALCIPESSRLYLEDGFPVLCEQEIAFELAHVNNVAFVAKSKQLYEIFQKQIPENFIDIIQLDAGQTVVLVIFITLITHCEVLTICPAGKAQLTTGTVGVRQGIGSIGN